MATASKRCLPGRLSPQLAAEICERIAGGQSALSLEREGIASHTAILRWCNADPGGFGADYARAREGWLARLAEETVDIADNAPLVAVGDGGSAAVQAAKLQIDTRKWLLSKLVHHIYGDKIAQEISGPAGGAIAHQITVEMVPAVADAGRQRVIEAQASEEE